MTQGRLAKRILLATPTGKRPRLEVEQESDGGITSRPGVEPAELSEVVENSRYFETSQGCCHRDHQRGKAVVKRFQFSQRSYT